jgi:flavin-dependent dehydrogenase
MAKAAVEPDVLVVGSHPCAHFAATLLRQNSSLRVTRADVADEVLDDRLVVINPEFFELSPLLVPLKSKLDLTPFHGLKFLADDPATKSEFADNDVAAYVASSKSIRAAFAEMSADADVQTIAGKSNLQINGVDEQGVHVRLDGKGVNPKLLIVACELPRDAERALGLQTHWENGVVHRYTYVKCKASKVPLNCNSGGKPLTPMSLDLKGKLTWAWALCGPKDVQFAVEQPLDQAKTEPSVELLHHWLSVLEKHGAIKSAGTVDTKTAVSIDLPFAGALAQEGVANRALLIGPAGGFYTACAEEIYPACWSAIFAADIAKKALKEKHLQDALQAYRHKWGATLGDYLRGPQQNLRFLLPLVYRNKVMTARLAEAILYGKSVVR